MMTANVASEISMRTTLETCVAALCKQHGFESSEKIVLETLTEMMQSYLMEIAKSTKLMSELSGRSSIIPSDVSLALIEMGLNVSDLIKYLQRREIGHIIVAGPRSTPITNEARTLRIGNVRPHPAYIPDYFLQFPDPHTYIQTPTQIEFSSDYETARASCAEQQRNIERSLVKFMRGISTNPSTKLLVVDDEEFKVMLPTDEPKSYLSALLPQDGESSETLLVVADEDEPSALKNLDNPFLRSVKMRRTSENS